MVLLRNEVHMSKIWCSPGTRNVSLRIKGSDNRRGVKERSAGLIEDINFSLSLNMAAVNNMFTLSTYKHLKSQTHVHPMIASPSLINDQLQSLFCTEPSYSRSQWLKSSVIDFSTYSTIYTPHQVHA